MLSVEEEDALDAGAIIEIGQELMICTDLNAVANTITVTRGARGTTATSHSIGDLVKIAPPFPRKNVFLMQYVTKLKTYFLQFLQ